MDDVEEIDIDEIEAASSDATPDVGRPPPIPPAPAAPAPAPPAPAAPAPEDPVGDALAWANAEEASAIIAVYEREAATDEDRSHQAFLQYEIGEVLESRVGDEPGAIKAYSKALKLDRAFLPNLWAVRRVFWQRKLWPNLLKLLDVEFKVVQDPAFRRTILLEKGDVLRLHQGDLAGAIECYEEAHRVDPEDIAPLLILEKLYAEQGQVAELRRVAQAHAEATRDPARKEALLVSLARLEEQLPESDYERCRGFLLEALEVSSNPDRVLYELERMAREAERPDDVLLALERREAYLLQSPEHVGDGSATRESGGAAASDLLESEPGQEVKDGLSSGVSEEPEAKEPEAKEPETKEPEAKEPEAKEPEAKEPEAEGAAGDVSASVQDLALSSTLPGVEETGGISAGALASLVPGIRRARILETQGDGAKAWALMGELLDRAGPHPIVLGLQSGLAARLGRWGDLAENLGRAATQAPAEARPFLSLERILALRKDGQSETAAQELEGLAAEATVRDIVFAIRQIDALAAGDVSAEADLVRVQLEQLEERSGDAPPEEMDLAVAYLRFQQVLLTIERGEPSEQVLAGLRQVRAVAPRHAAATALLEGTLLEQRAWDDLVALYRQELVDAQGERAEYLLESLAEIQAVYRKDLEGWVDALHQLVVRHPESCALRFRLADALEASEQWEEVVATLEVLLGQEPASDHEAAIEAGLRAARCAWERLDDVDRAARILTATLRLEPGHPEALATLEWILREAGRTEDRVALLRQEADGGLQPDLQREHLLRLGWLLERDLGRPAEAAEAYERMCQVDPEDPDALALFGRALRLAGEPSRAADVMEQAAVLAPVGRARSLRYHALGEFLLDELGDPDRAEEAFLRAHASHPEDLAPLLALADLASGRRDWPRYGEVLDELLRSDLSSDLRRQVIAELAWLTESPLSDPTATAAHLSTLETFDPPLVTAAWARARLAVANQEWALAAEALDSVRADAEKAGAADLAVALAARSSLHAAVAGESFANRLTRAAELGTEGGPADVLAAELAPGEGASAAARLQRRAESFLREPARSDWALIRASVLAQGGNLGEAAEVLQQALRGGSDDLPLLSVLRHIASRFGDPRLEAECCERMAGAMAQDELAAALLREGAALVPETVEAARMLHAALERSPDTPEIAAALVACLLALDRGVEADRVLGFRLSQAEDDAENLTLRFKRACLRQDQLEDVAGAAVDLYQVLSIEPDHGLAMVRLARLQAEDGDYGAAAALLRQRLDLAAGEELDPELQEAHFLLSEVLERMGRPLDEVLDPLDALLLIRPEDVEALERKVAALVRGRDVDGAVAALDTRYALESDAARRAEGELRKARLYRDHAANRDQARQAFERARELDPLNQEAILALCDLYRGFGDDSSLGYVLSGAVDAYRDALGQQGPMKPDVVRFLARLFEKGGEKDAQFFALSSLDALDALTDSERQALERYRGALVDRQPGRLTGELWASLLTHPDALGPVADLWDIISPASYRLTGKELSDLGLGRGDRLDAGSASGGAKTVFDLASGLGVRLEEVYRREAASQDIALLATTGGGVLVVRSGLKARLSPRVRHQVGEQLALLRLGAAALDEIDPGQVEALVTSAVREGRPDFETSVSGKALEEAAKQIKKALPRKLRKAVPIAGAAVAPGTLDLPRWRLGIRRTAGRAGLLCSGDLLASLEEVTGRPVAEAVTRPEGQDLMRFALSDAHMELRMRLGVAR